MVKTNRKMTAMDMNRKVMGPAYIAQLHRSQAEGKNMFFRQDQKTIDEY